MGQLLELVILLRLYILITTLFFQLFGVFRYTINIKQLNLVGWLIYFIFLYLYSLLKVLLIICLFFLSKGQTLEDLRLVFFFNKINIYFFFRMLMVWLQFIQILGNSSIIIIILMVFYFFLQIVILFAIIYFSEGLIIIGVAEEVLIKTMFINSVRFVIIKIIQIKITATIIAILDFYNYLNFLYN